LEEIFAVAKEKRIFVIADGAHSFDRSVKNCHAKILSFGREKDVSCISGGALLWPNISPFSVQFEKITLPFAQKKWTVQHLIQPLVFSLTLPWWNIGGKYLAAVCNKTKLLPRAVTQSERNGKEDFPRTQMPPEIQHVLRRNLSKRTDDLTRRALIAQVWKRALEKLFPDSTITIPENGFRVIMTGIERADILYRAKKGGFHLAEWDGEPIAPKGVNLENFGYQKGQCPNAEHFATHYVTFPTNKRTTEKDIERFAELFTK
jgi:dTDP-4-amino-4,6-dideoxygalactose transaminase